MWLQVIQDEGKKPDDKSYNSVINACAQGGQVEEAMKWLQVMKAQGIKPNVITYNSVIKACGYAKPGANLQVCCLLVSDMEWHHVLPNEYTLPAMLNCCNYARPRNPSLAVEWFQKFSPNVHVNKHVKQALSKATGHETAQQLIAWALATYPNCRAQQAQGGNGGRHGKQRANNEYDWNGGRAQVYEANPNAPMHAHAHPHPHAHHVHGHHHHHQQTQQGQAGRGPNVCFSFQRTGSCRFGEGCRFRHENPAAFLQQVGQALAGGQPGDERPADVAASAGGGSDGTGTGVPPNLDMVGPIGMLQAQGDANTSPLDSANVLMAPPDMLQLAGLQGRLAGQMSGLGLSAVPSMGVLSNGQVHGLSHPHPHPHVHPHPHGHPHPMHGHIHAPHHMQLPAHMQMAGGYLNTGDTIGPPSHAPRPGQKICFEFRKQGWCRFADACRYAHAGGVAPM